MQPNYPRMLLSTNNPIPFFATGLFARSLEAIGTLEVKMNEEEFAEVRSNTTSSEQE